MSGREFPGVTGQWVTFKSGADEVRGYLAMPESDKPLGAIVTAPENLGVTEHRQEETRRLAAEGFAVLTVDPYSRIGGKPPSDYTTPEERRIKAFHAARDEWIVPDMQAGFDYLAARPDVDAKRIGTLGYCLGGGTVLAWSIKPNDLACAVVLYALPIIPPQYRPDNKPLSRLDGVERISSPMQLHFGEDDEAIPLEQTLALKDAIAASTKAPTEFYTYPGARHAYMDSTLERYSPEAAKLTYDRFVAFFHKHLDAGATR